MKRLLAAIALSCAFAQAQTVQPLLQPHQTFVDGAGFPCAGCSLYSYASGTTTPKATYTDSTGVTPNTNPVILDAAGGASVWLASGSYKFVLKGVDGSAIWTVDNVNQVLTTPSTTTYLPLSGGTLTGPLTGTSANFADAGVFTDTQMRQTTVTNLNVLSPNAFGAVQGGHVATEAITGAALIPSDATIFQVNALAGYLQNNSASVNPVGVYTQVNAGVNGTKLWGANPVVSDFDLSEVIHTGVTMHGIEVDVNALGAGTAGDGILFQGNLSGNTSLGDIGGMHLAAPFSGKWNYGFIIDDSSMFAGSAGVQLGAQGATSANSYSVIMASRNSGGTRLVNALYADGSGLVHLQGNAGTVIDGGELLSKAGTSSTGAAAGDIVLYNGNFLRSDSPAHNATYRLIGSAVGTAGVNIDPDAQGSVFNGTVSSLAGVIISPTDTGPHGTGTKFQKSDGTGVNGNCVKFDAAGNITDSGAPCGTGGGTGTSWATDTGGTNTTGTFTVGSGATFGTAGSGTIQATSLTGNISEGQVTGLVADLTPTDLGTITYNSAGTTTFAAASKRNVAGIVTATHSTSTTFSPTGLVKWGSYMVEVKQDATGGGVTFTLGTAGTCTAWKIGGGGGGTITLSATANAIDLLTFTYDGANCLANFRTLFN